MTIIDVANEPLAQVRAKLREARDQGLPLEEETVAESRVPAVADSDDDEVIEASASAASTDTEDQQVEDAGQRTQTPQTPPQKSELDLERERFKTLSANAHTISEENKRLKREYEEAQQRLRAVEEAQQKAEVERQQREFQQVEDWIKTNVPQELQETVRRDYRNRLLSGELAEFGKHVQAQQEEVQRAKAEMELAKVRAELPNHVESIVNFVGKTAEVDPESFADVTRQAPFRELLATYQSPRDLMIIGEVLHAVALAEKTRNGKQAEANRQEAIASGAGARVGTIASAAGGGKTNAQRIMDIPKSDWAKFKEQLKRSGNPSAALNSLGA